MSENKGKKKENKKQGGRAAVAVRVIVFAVLIFAVLFGINHFSGQQAAEPDPTTTVTPGPSETVYETPSPEPTSTTITLSAAGDTMLHSPQNNDAYDEETGTYDYSDEFKYIKSYLESADIAVGNLETTFAGGPNYSTYPQFNSPEIMATNLKDIGIDLLCTSNNHCMDKGIDGLVSTLGFLDEAGIDHVGTYASSEEREESRGIVIENVEGIRIAFLAYTYGTNGIGVPSGKEYAVNLIYKDYMTNLSIVNEELITADLEAAKAMDPDIICVFMHWGYEYHTAQSDAQEELADLLFENGADIILGGHPHVLQPMEKRTITTADGEEKDVFAAYSLGNFISSQNDEYTDTSVILNIEITKDLQTGGTTIGEISYIPVYMLDRELGADERFVLLDIRAAMADYEAGGTEIVDSAQYERLKKALDDIHSILGEEYDIINSESYERTGAAAA